MNLSLGPGMGASADAVPVQAGSRWSYAGLGSATALFLYLHLFHFPLVPVWHWGDQYYYLEHAERMLHGAVLYRDLFQFNLPGTEYLYFFLFRIFGVRLWIAPLALLVAGTAATLLVYALARKVLVGAAGLVSPLALLTICLRTSLDGSHHWYSTVCVLWAVYLISGGFPTHFGTGMAVPQGLTSTASASPHGTTEVVRSHNANSSGRIGLRLMAAGALLGMASVFTSSRGLFAVIGVAAFLVWKFGVGRAAWRAIATLLLPYGSVLGCVFLFLVRDAGVRIVFDSVVGFPLRYYPAGDANSFSVYFDEWQVFFPFHLRSLGDAALWLAVNAAVPLALAAFFARLLRMESPESRSSLLGQRLMLLAMVGLFVLLAVAGAPSAPRMNCAAAFAYIVAAHLLDRAGRRRTLQGVVVVLILLGAGEMAGAKLRWSQVLEGPRGPAVFQNAGAFAQFAWVHAHARPGDRLFGSPDMNFLLGLANPAPAPYVTPDAYTRPGQVESVIVALENEPTRFVIWSEGAEKAGGAHDSLTPLREFLHRNYHLAERFEDGTQILVQDVPSSQRQGPRAPTRSQ